MRITNCSFVTLAVVLAMGLVACGASRTGEEPETGADATDTPPAAPPHEIDVGMTMEEPKDEEPVKDRAPPPTQAYTVPEKTGLGPSK
jgi:hypothetical protein